MEESPGSCQIFRFMSIMRSYEAVDTRQMMNYLLLKIFSRLLNSSHSDWRTFTLSVAMETHM